MNQKRPCDRFIPIRNPRQMRLEPVHSAEKLTDSSTNYSRILSPSSSKYLKFTTPDNQKHQSLTDFLYKSFNKRQNRNIFKATKQTRKAVRILDAPDVVNNFYYNPLDWSKNNRVGIALSESAYFFQEGKQVLELQRCSNIHITCLKFHLDDSLCLLGDSSGRIDVYDCEKRTRIRQINVHYNRVGVIQNSDISEVFISGSKDKLVKLNDLRLKKTDIMTMEKHLGQICGLSNAKNYLASGGNDNKVIIWDLRKNAAINQIKEHKSAVKALAWCPWKTSLLASGGGRHDKKIIFWNGNKNVVQHRFDTQSQVISLQWKQETQQLISGHFCGKSSYCLVWNGLDVTMKLKGHESRLLGMKLSPNKGDQLCTIASDETLRFWDISTDESKMLSSKVKLNARRHEEFQSLEFR